MTAPAPSHAVRAVVVFDRDGTLNELALDEWTGRYESPYAASDVRLIDGVAEGLSRLDELGVACFVASNQPAAAKGRTTLRNLAAVHQAVDSLLRASGPAPRRYGYCLHHPAGRGRLGRVCLCRKPKPGMLRALTNGVAAPVRYLVGDSDADIGAGNALGWRTIRVDNPRSAHRRRGQYAPAYSVPTTAHAMAAICHELTKPR